MALREQAYRLTIASYRRPSSLVEYAVTVGLGGRRWNLNYNFMTCSQFLSSEPPPILY